MNINMYCALFSMAYSQSTRVFHTLLFNVIKHASFILNREIGIRKAVNWVLPCGVRCGRPKSHRGHYQLVFFVVRCLLITW